MHLVSADRVVASLTLLVVHLISAAANLKHSSIYQQLIRGVKVRPAQEQQGNGSSSLGKHKHGYPGPEKAGGAPDDGAAPTGPISPDGGCKGRSPQGVRRARHQGAASMAVSI